MHLQGVQCIYRAAAMIYDLNTEEYGKNSFPSLNRFYYAQELTFGFSGRHVKGIAIRYL